MHITKNTRFVALDTLRGLCAIFVAVFHFSAHSTFYKIPFIQNAFLFVDFFFVLSGFVIAANYGAKLQGGLDIGKFMFLRLGRLYPLHLFVLMMCIGLVAVRGPGDTYPLSGFWISAFLLQIFSDGHLGNWNLPSWSISAEMWAYLVFAILCRYCPRKFFLSALFLIIAISPILLAQTSDRYTNVCYLPGGLTRCLYGFCFGVLAFKLWENKIAFFSNLSWATCTLSEVIAVSASLALVSIAGAGFLSPLCAPVFALTVLVFAREGGAIGSVLRFRPLAFVGTLSYSIYMTHEFIQARLLNLIGEASLYRWLPIIKGNDAAQTLSNADGVYMATDVTVILMVLIVIACAYVSYSLVEEPFRKWSRGEVKSQRYITAQ